MRTIFHVTHAAAWQSAQNKGEFAADTLLTEGFIHLSRPHQLAGVVERYFPGARNLVLLQVNQEKVNVPVKYEGAEKNLFPHAYGPLNLSAVVEAFEMNLAEEGFAWPPAFRLVGDCLIRQGLPGDEAEIASVHTHAWQQSYRGLLPDSFLNERPLSFRSRLNWWKSVVEGKDPWRVCVAESAENGIIGFCGYGPARETEMAESGEIGALYCLNEFKNKGIGAALLREVHRRQKQEGHKYSYLWVLRGNPTIEFYRRVGGRELAKKKTVDLGGQSLEEIAFQWDL